jgi:fructoselysine 6-kinase
MWCSGERNESRDDRTEASLRCVAALVAPTRSLPVDMRVAAIGDNCIDVYPKLDRSYCTGNAVDFAVHMQRLGIRSSMVGTTGDDDRGRWMIETLAAEGLDLSHFHTGHGPTAVAYMDMVGSDRVHVDYVEGVLENVRYAGDDIEFAASHSLVHSTPWGHAEAHLRAIRRRGALISFDYSTYLGDPSVRRTLPFVDYAFFSFPERDKDVEAYLRAAVERGCRIAVGTFGENGSLAWDGRDWHAGEVVRAAVVNTIGAGDAFIAGFMYGVLTGRSVDESLGQGAETASRVVGVFGPWPELASGGPE